MSYCWGSGPQDKGKTQALRMHRGRGWGPLQRLQDGQYEGASRGRSDTKRGDSRGPSGVP